MILEPKQIFEEYREGVKFKSSMGNRGLYEQTLMNERFFNGDQWYGAKCGNDRPLVRHNIVKRIGDFKMAQVLSAPITVNYSADGVPNTVGLNSKIRAVKKDISLNGKFDFEETAGVEEINMVMSALGNYRNVTAERVGLTSLFEQMLKNAYISGSGILYTYWDPFIRTGLYADEGCKVPIVGDINCEVLNVENVYFGDPYCDSVEQQPYIIIASRIDVDAVRREARSNGMSEWAIGNIVSDGDDGKVLVLTRLYKEYRNNGHFSIMCKKVTEKAVVRKSFNTGLRMYPLTLFTWDKRNNHIYGESEVTYLIPNQIAINRMITAKVWATMTMGMPMMVVNGDTVSDNITNDPGQIIKIYGSNEDVAGAVKYVTPPDFGSNFDESINNLIENTLTQSGANEVARGDSDPDNALALMTLRDAANLPLQLVRSRFYCAVEELARIWADFWITQYGDRRIKIEDENGIWYMPFVSERYRDLLLSAHVEVGADTVYSAAESINILTGLYEKGIINKKQYLNRLPAGIVPNISGLLNEIDDEEPKEEEK